MNRVLFADDCLDILNDRTKLPDDSVDLIYLDPPFNSDSVYNLPFKRRDRSVKPVQAFKDTWEWSDFEDSERLDELRADPRTRSLATIVTFAQEVEEVRGRRKRRRSLAAYLLNMSFRLLSMRRILNSNGSIYLHCDPTASHYLKLVMDSIWGKANFRNEIAWCYRGAGYPKKDFGKKHDVILRYSKSNVYVINLDELRMPYAEATVERFKHRIGNVRGDIDYGQQTLNRKGRHPDDWWQIQPIAPSARERLGYPTQKPLSLLEYIIKASSHEGALVLDPFCGCGTTAHAAESLDRRWIGIDISKFSTELVRERIVSNFKYLTKNDVVIHGTPQTIDEVRELAARDRFEFEKWVCGRIGAEGMYHAPGTRGADGGVDGVLKFYPFREGREMKAEYAIIQVKSGNVAPDSVRALRERVARFGVTAGVMVCFEQHMGTVENQRSHDTFEDDIGKYPVIQGYSIEDMLRNLPLDLPLYGRKRQGARLEGNF